MYFTSFEHLINMDGHGLYVWFCYAVFVCFMVGNICIVKCRQRHLRKQIKSRQHRR